VTGSRIRVETLPVGPLACNCTVVMDGATRQAIVIDPGDEAPRILAALSGAAASATFLLHTHAHFDHIGATGPVQAATGAAICLHPGDRFLYEQLPDQGRMFGFSFDAAPEVNRWIGDGETFEFGESRIRAIHTPGHSPGSTCFLLEGEEPLLFAGDTLFRDSIGRTDLWGGSFDTIETSIRQKLYSLGDDLRVIPGHGDETTVGRERRGNPFVRGV
jgi:glyoxylase-like metal-dependent hydrolase (beta-lactamase superfamily II)